MGSVPGPNGWPRGLTPIATVRRNGKIVGRVLRVEGTTALSAVRSVATPSHVVACQTGRCVANDSGQCMLSRVVIGEGGQCQIYQDQRQAEVGQVRGRRRVRL